MHGAFGYVIWVLDIIEYGLTYNFVHHLDSFGVFFFVMGSFEIGDCDENSRSRKIECFLFPRRNTDMYYKYVHSSPVLLDTILFPKREVNVILRGRMT